MIFFVAIALGQTVVNAYGPGYFLAMGGIGLILSFIFAFDPSPAVKFARGKISGPTLSGFKQVEFELSSIDKHRTLQQSLWNKLNGRTIVYAKDGEKIQIDHASFEKTKRAEILEILNLTDYP